ncbi:hypothetical protein HPB49_008016 [Dermacentor silvarum]|uniref:Uncharacterized protein n=1 Tax=Dermacentor silvarum TaxID=543639 RepID=A0ACB8D3D5_DERSI|nr:hypothetical protein HPB49_008016 [Dermacentor silvarum]
MRCFQAKIARRKEALQALQEKVNEAEVQCKACKAQLQLQQANDALYGLVEYIDRGNLRYPTMEIIGICKLMCIFIDKVMKIADVRRSGKICDLLSSALLPHLLLCRELTCGADDHAMEVCKVFIRKLLLALLANWAGNGNMSVERLVRLAQKPLARKVLRL